MAPRKRGEVAAYESNRLRAVGRASGPIRPQAPYKIEPEGGGSRVGFGVPTLLGPARLLGPLVRLAAPIVERALRKDLRRLKERLEAEARPTS